MRQYIAIDLKSFYASVECLERGLDPLTTNLVVADAARTEKTICLAVTPSLKAFGIPGRPRLFEVVQRVREVNADRKSRNRGRPFMGKSYLAPELQSQPLLEVDYVVAPPQMAHYIDYSTKIYDVYLQYIAPEDMHVYSIDEVFIDATPYLHAYGGSVRALAKAILQQVYRDTGITATAGIGPNLYLAKIAMDIMGKHVVPDAEGVRIAELDVASYRKQLWHHRPLTDFWRVGKGYQKKLEAHGMYTMGDIARCSLGASNEYFHEGLLFKLFGKNAELLIDHAWGYEPCTMEAIKSYRAASHSVGAGQVLQDPYVFDKARLVMWEIADGLALDLVDRHLVTNQLVMTVGYDIENLTDPHRKAYYKGEITVDAYGRSVPKQAHGTENIEAYTASGQMIREAAMRLFDRIVNENLLIRRLQLSCQHVIPPEAIPQQAPVLSCVDLFAEEEVMEVAQPNSVDREKEHKIQETVLALKKRFGKNAVLKGVSLEEGATGRERNAQIGGHRA